MADYQFFAQIKKTLSVLFAYRNKILVKVKQTPSPPHLISAKHWMTGSSLTLTCSEISLTDTHMVKNLAHCDDMADYQFFLHK